MQETDRGYTFKAGDILRLKRDTPYFKQGKYVILSVDNTVCLARTKKKAGERRITNHFAYLLITDIDFFKPTKKRFRPLH